MKVVLDTNIIVPDFHLTSNTLRFFFDGLERAGHTLFVLSIVLDETVNKYREMLLEVENEIHRIQKKYKQLTGKELQFSPDTTPFQELVNTYRQEIDRSMKNGRPGIVRFVPIPDVSHQELIRKALLRQKPFSDKGTGYRDALIWQSIIWLAKTYGVERQKVAFVTANIKDFADETLCLHPDLRRELESAGLSSDCVILYPSLKAFNDEQIKGQFEELKVIETSLNDNTYQNLDFKKALLRTLAEHFLTSGTPIALNENDRGPIIKAILEIDQYEVVDVRRWNTFDDGSLLLDVNLKASCLVSTPSPLYEHLSSLNWPANEYVEKNVHLSLTLVLEEKDKTLYVDSHDIQVELSP